MKTRWLSALAGGFDAAKIAATDATVPTKESGAEAGLRVATGHNQPWPGITLPVPDGQ